jgi:hypothetical protein
MKNLDLSLLTIAIGLLKLVSMESKQTKNELREAKAYSVKNILSFVTIFVTIFGANPVFADQVTMKVTRLVSYVTSIGLVAALGFFVYELLVAMAAQQGFARVKWVAFGAVLMGIAKYLLPALIGAVS